MTVARASVMLPWMGQLARNSSRVLLRPLRRGQPARYFATSFFATLGLIGLAAHLLLPWAVRNYALPALAARTHATVSVATIRVRGFASVELHDMIVDGPAGRATAPSVRGAVSLWAALRGQPFVSLTATDAIVELRDTMPPPPRGAAPTVIARQRVRRLTLHNAQVRHPRGRARLGYGTFEVAEQRARLEDVTLELTSLPAMPARIAQARVRRDHNAWQATAQLDAHTVLELAATPTAQQARLITAHGAKTPTELSLHRDRTGVRVAGEFVLPHTTLIAATQGISLLAIPAHVEDLAVRGQLDARFDAATQRLHVTSAHLRRAGVAVSLWGEVAFGAAPRAQLHVSLPPTDCQAVLAAVPPQLLPSLAGYQLDGTLEVDLHADISPTGGVLRGLDRELGCRVVSAPAFSPEALAKQPRQTLRALGLAPLNYVSYATLPPALVAALVAVEDPTFFRRAHFDLPGLGRALAEGWRTGQWHIGGSTISMQLAKNLYLHQGQTLPRKLQEVVLAWHLEHTLAASQRLELYANVIEFGPGLRGVAAAARDFFAKPALDLTIKEAAYLAATVSRPSTAYKNVCLRKADAAMQARVTRILGLLVYAGEITSEEWDEAARTPLEFARRNEPLATCLQRQAEALRAAQRQLART